MQTLELENIDNVGVSTPPNICALELSKPKFEYQQFHLFEMTPGAAKSSHLGWRLLVGTGPTMACVLYFSLFVFFTKRKKEKVQKPNCRPNEPLTKEKSI